LEEHKVSGIDRSSRRKAGIEVAERADILARDEVAQCAILHLSFEVPAGRDERKAALISGNSFQEKPAGAWGRSIASAPLATIANAPQKSTMLFTFPSAGPT
jgi:hypothetical protein